MTFDRAIATLRIAQAAADAENEALSVLLEESLRYKRVLQWYADKNNYIDGVPMLKDPNTGLLSADEEGAMARKALRLVDIHGMPILRAEEGNTHV